MGQEVATRALTAQQAEFVVRFTSVPGCIGNASASALSAGYSEHTASEIGRQLLTKPHVREAIDAALRRQISGPMAAKASALLERVVDDEDAPLKVRVEAAKTILDRAGIVPPSAFEKAAEAAQRLAEKAVGTMTLREVRAEIALLGGADAAGAGDGPVVVDAGE